LANELSRVGDRLTRARERTWKGATSLLLPVPGSRKARREPTRVPSAQEREEQARRAEDKRPQTFVAIRVEVRQSPNETGGAENTAQYVEAHVAEVAEAHHHEFAIEDERPAPVDAAYEVDSSAEPVFALPAFNGTTGTYNRQGRVSSAVHYLAVRAVSAYLAQRTYSPANAAEPRLIDRRA
jgi:hypothetical protein